MKKDHVIEITITRAMVDDDIPKESVICHNYTTRKIRIPQCIRERITNIIDSTMQRILNIIQSDTKSRFFRVNCKEVPPDDPRLTPPPQESTNGDHLT